MGAKVVPESDALDPESTAIRNQVKVVRALRWVRLAKPMHHVWPIRPVLVAQRLQSDDSRVRLFEIPHSCHDVDDRLGRKAWYGSATDVLNRTGQPRHKQ